MPRAKVKKKKKSRRSLAATRPIIVKLGRLNEEVREFALASGVTVKQVLDLGNIDGGTVAVKINGRKVNLSQKLTRSCTLVSIPEVTGARE